MKAQVFKSIFLFCLLHLAIISNAQIVYTNVNPDDTIQDLNFSYLTYQTYPLDLNNDGVTDFDLNQSYSKTALNSGTLCAYYHLNKICYAYPKNLNAIASDSIGGLSNSSLSIIEERLSWRDTSANHGYNNLANYYYTSIRHCPPASPATTSTGGNWYSQTDKYLGLKFVKGGLTYYGWARLQIASASSITVKDYAYNSIPNQPILAGETSCTTPTVNLTQSGSLSFCTGDSVTFTANGSGYQYQWKKGGVNISGATKQIYVAKTAGTYKCKVNNSCGSITSAGKTVTTPCREIAKNANENDVTNKFDGTQSPMNTPYCNCSIQGYGCGALNPGCVMYCHSYCANCAAPLSLSASGSLSFCSGDSVVLTVNRTGTYQWKKNGVNMAGATFNSYTAKTPGTYKCKVTNTYCGAEVSPGKKITVPCRKSNETFSETLEHISVYPNPATNSITIKFPSDEAGEIQIVNLFGQIVYSEKINEEQASIDVSRFPAGMYVVRWSIRTPSENSGESNETKTFTVVK